MNLIEMYRDLMRAKFMAWLREFALALLGAVVVFGGAVVLGLVV